METEILIIGAGLAGLSAGYHLGDREHILVEAEESVGGLCKSFFVDGFHFDCTGHLIHFRTPEGKKIIRDLLGDQIQEHERKAAIFLEGRFTDYPFQANTFGLPPEVIKECLHGFVQTLHSKHKSKINNFRDWIYDTFGEGIAKYFMVPYNEKLWQHDLRDVALDWVNWSIPKPGLEEVINGALGIKNRQFGYNPVFYYPVEGGIGILPRSFPVRGRLMLGNPVTKINLRKRRVTLRDGTVIRYRTLLSTMPLHAFLMCLDETPAPLSGLGEKLRYVSVLNLNLGIERESVIPYHWIYFPERDKPFYRIGCPSNFSRGVAPPSMTSLFVEVSLKPSAHPPMNDLIEQCIASLQASNILLPDDRIAIRYPMVMQYAYVIFDSARKRTVERVLKYLQQRDVCSFGRYGSWTYSSMEDAVLQGKEFAERITTEVTESTGG